jgi:uncharacterized protein (TIGR03437 family)
MRLHFLFGTLLLTLAATVSAQVTVVNSASFRQNQPLAAGSIASAFGSFSGATAASATALPLPKTLGGVQVLVGAVACPLFYASSSQVNFQLPASLAPGVHTVRVLVGPVEYSGGIIVMRSAPGLFTFFNTGEPPRAAALNQDGVTVNSAEAPEARGRLITLFATGSGPLTASVADGEATPVSPLIRTVNDPIVYIAGVQAQVEFSGLTPTAVGLWQINVRIPEQSFIRGRVPVQVFMDGVDSNEVSIFVAQ